MSGGVDSAVAAARAVDAGHEVVGVHLALAREPATSRTGARGCCTLEDAHDARRVADTLGIPFYVWDLSQRFEAEVVEDFVAEYAAGRTPNPCVRCNERIKFSALLDKALALGFDAVCTGHYARLVVAGVDVGARGTGGGSHRGGVGDADGAGGLPELHRAVDAGKDQSYVLAVLPPERLAHALFPLGDTVYA
jgi:tRNA-uridine 2-sulfurtransferase